ncbi:MAG TPA: RNA polymerase sigma factor [Actinomycetota bacterium]|nr:RNA polymerase sigma factor [Actinomycetota bacterium]
MTERTLVEAAQAGRSEATVELIERYYSRVYSFVATLHCGDAEDLTQEVFARALGALPRFNGEYQFGAWLIQIARNVCIDEARRQSHRPQPTDPVDLVELEPANDQPDDVWESVSSQLAVATVHRGLARLPQRQRTVLVLRELEGMSYADIAIALRISTRAVEISLSRARKRMRLELKRLEHAEGEMAACRRTATLLASDPNALGREEVAEHLRECSICQSLARRRRPGQAFHAAWVSMLGASGMGIEFLRRQLEAGQRVVSGFVNTPGAGSLSPFARLAEVGATMVAATAVAAGTLGAAAPAPARAVPAAAPIVAPPLAQPVQPPASALPAVPAVPPSRPAAAPVTPATTGSSVGQTLSCVSTGLSKVGSSLPAVPAALAAPGAGQVLSELLSPVNALSPVLACDPALAGVGQAVTGVTGGVQDLVNGVEGTGQGSPAPPAGGGLLSQLLGSSSAGH